MKKKEKKARLGATDIVLIALCAVFLVGMLTFLSPCGPKEDGTWMNCHKAGTALTVLAVAALAISVVHAFAPRAAKKISDIVLLLCGILAAYIPGNIISLCMMPEMQCRAVTRPGAIVFGVLIAVAAVLDLAIVRKAKD